MTIPKMVRASARHINGARLLRLLLGSLGAWLFVLALGTGKALAANVVIPAGVSGLMTVEFTYTEADFVDGFGIVDRSSGNPVYRELINTSTARIGRRVYTLQVNGGETFEFYLEANKAGLPDFTHAFYSSNPTFNAGVDAAFPEHVEQPQQTAYQSAHNVWALRWEDKNSADPLFDADFNDVVVFIRVGGDTDGDGLWDDWEQNGIDMDGDGVIDLALNQAPYNANPNHRDVYLELDYMAAADHDHRPLLDPACDPTVDPTSAACGNTVAQRLIQSFANAPGGGITLHVDTGPGTPYDLSNGSPLGGGTAIPEVTPILGPDSGTMAGPNNDFWDLKAAAFDDSGARRFVFHYGILGHAFANCTTYDASGQCTVMGASTCFSGDSEGGSLGANDFIVTLSPDCNANLTAAHPDILRPYQIGTIMHELGHTLGLGHGGRPNNTWDDTNYKPNHLSIMNYSFQFSGLGTTLSGTTYVGGTYDYSRAALIDLPESGLLETDGLGPALWNPNLYTIYYNGSRSTKYFAKDNGGIDWNHSSGIEATRLAVAVDVNGDGSTSTLLGSDDWTNLAYGFQGGPGMANGERDFTVPQQIEPDVRFASVQPMDHTEVCDGFDNDGNGLVDEGFDQDLDGLADCFDSCATRSRFNTAPPVLTAPADVTLAIPTGGVGATVKLGIAKNDACLRPTALITSVNGTPTSTPVTPTTVFSVGTSIVEWKVVDALGQTATGTQKVIVLLGSSLFGFEQLSGWSSPQATLSLVTTPKKQGDFALAVTGQGWMEINSIPFSTSTLTGVTPILAYDLFIPVNPPNPYWIGATQLYVTCPSANVFNRYIGQVGLTGKPLGAFSTISYALPADIVSMFNGSFQDVSLKIVLNVNRHPQPFVLDNIRFQ